MKTPPDSSHLPQHPSTPEDLHAHYAWKHGHWAFFVLIQASIICLTRLKFALESRDADNARRLFEQTATLMLGSAVAMRIAGDVNPESYKTSVIPSMLAARAKFSGSDSSDHAELIRCYKSLTASLMVLDAKLTLAHLRFVAAVRSAKEAHKFVCAEHGGNERPPISVNPDAEQNGVTTIEKLTNCRIKDITPATPARCPFHS